MFKMNEQRYSLPLELLVKVIEAPKITEVPLVPKNVEGVLCDGGEIIPVVSIGSDAKTVSTDRSHEIVLLVKATEGNIGIKINSIEKVTRGSDDLSAIDTIDMNLTEFLRKTLGEYKED